MNIHIYTCFLIILSTLFSSQDYRSESTFLFCLKSNVQPMSINKVKFGVETDIKSINDFIIKHRIISIERWMPYATEEDFDGNIYLNRIYKVYLNTKHKISIDILIKEISSFSEIFIILIPVCLSKFIIDL